MGDLSIPVKCTPKPPPSRSQMRPEVSLPAGYRKTWVSGKENLRGTFPVIHAHSKSWGWEVHVSRIPVQSAASLGCWAGDEEAQMGVYKGASVSKSK